MKRVKYLLKTAGEIPEPVNNWTECMKFIALRLLGMGLLIALSVGCTSSSPPVYLRKEIQIGDRYRDWALVYYQSWRRDRKSEFLQLARTQMAQAIMKYFEIQQKMGHSFPAFYEVDDKRRESCDFLSEMDRMGFRFQVAFQNSLRTGCFH